MIAAAAAVLVVVVVVLVVRDARHRTQLYTPLVTIYYVRLLTGYKINGSAMDIAELFGFMPLANHLQNASRFLQLPPSPPPAQSGVKNGPSTSTPYINGQWQRRSLPFGKQLNARRHGSQSCLFRKK